MSELLERVRPEIEAVAATTNDMTEIIEKVRPSVINAISELLNWDEMSSGLTAGMQKIWEAAYSGASDGLADISKLTDFHGVQRMRMVVNSLQKSMAETVVRNANNPDMSVNGLIDNVIAPLKDQKHIQALAADEVSVAEAVGEFNGAKAKGYKRKSWYATGDSKVRLSHRRTNGQTVDIDEPFRNGLMYPRDPNAPPGERIECRCKCIYMYE